MEIFLKKTLGSLAPADQDAVDALQKIKLGDVLRVKITRPRNYQFHKKFFSLLDVAFSNQNKYTSREAFRAEVIILSGFFTVHLHVDGTSKLDAKSISFANMDEDEFGQLYQHAIDAIIGNFIPEIDQESLQAEVDRIIQFA